MLGMQIGLTLLSVVMIGCGQILFQAAARDGVLAGFNWPALVSWLSPSMIAALAVSVVATALWVWVLRSASLAVVYPLYALTFVLVPVLDWLVYGTALTPQHGIGAAAIVLGVWLMASAG